MKTEKYLEDYYAWLKANTFTAQIGEFCEITTPFLNHNNDSIQIYVKEKAGQLLFTDDGYTLSNLEMGGFHLTSVRKGQIAFIANQYGVEFDGHEITANCPAKDFAFKKHMLVQAILHIDDMYMVNQQHVESLFTDDIAEYMKANSVFYTPDVQFAGKSGFSHHYDFVLQRSKNKPERLCVAMNRVDRANMNNVLFGWMDTQPARAKTGSDARLIVFLNDSLGASSAVTNGLKNYDVILFAWSRRNDPDQIDILSA